MSTEPKCELSNHDLAKRVVVLTHELAKTKGQSWMLSIPVNFNKDPDILFIECADRLLTATAQLAAKDAEIQRLKGVIRTAIEHGKQSTEIDTVDALYSRLKHLYNL